MRNSRLIRGAANVMHNSRLVHGAANVMHNSGGSNAGRDRPIALRELALKLWPSLLWISRQCLIASSFARWSCASLVFVQALVHRLAELLRVEGAPRGVHAGARDMSMTAMASEVLELRGEVRRRDHEPPRLQDRLAVGLPLHAY